MRAANNVACSDQKAPSNRGACATSSKSNGATRSYVWRGPSRNKVRDGIKISASVSLFAPHCPGRCVVSGSRERSLQRGTTRALCVRAQVAVPSAPAPPAPAASDPEDDDIDNEGGPAATGDRDKDWAALTTWLRMNLHHPRTAKRQVLFVGHQLPDGR